MAAGFKCIGRELTTTCFSKEINHASPDSRDGWNQRSTVGWQLEEMGKKAKQHGRKEKVVSEGKGCKIRRDGKDRLEEELWE